MKSSDIIVYFRMDGTSPNPYETPYEYIEKMKSTSAVRSNILSKLIFACFV